MLIELNYTPYRPAFSFIFFLLLICTSLQGQQGLRSLGKAEKRWVIRHPFAAMKARKINDQCTSFYDRKNTNPLLDTFPAGGKLDAYRHVLTMAAFSQQINTRKVRSLGKAHEEKNYEDWKKSGLEEGERADSLSSVMDLYNNELGIRIGCNFRNLPLQELSELVIRSITQGEALIMKRDLYGNYEDCDGNLVNLSQYRNQWHVPKCLVPSSYSP